MPRLLSRSLSAAPCRPFPLLCLFALWLLLMGTTPLAAAQSQRAPTAASSASAPQDPAALLDDLRGQLDGMKKQLGGNLPAEQLAQLRDRAQAVQGQAEEAAGALAPALANVEARLAELGPAPKDRTEAPDVATQRATLEKSRGQLEGQVKLAKLIGVEADQTGEELSQRRRAHFTAELYERTPSVLAPRFWQDLLQGLRRDQPRVGALVREAGAAAQAAPLSAWAGWTIAVVLAWVVRRLAGRGLMAVLSRRVPPGRLRRSLLATAVALLSVLIPVTIASGLQRVLQSGATPSPALQSLLEALVGAVVFGAYLSGLGRALLAVRRPSWRLPNVPDGVAQGLSHVPTQLAVAIVVGWLAERLATVVNTSLATLVAFNCLFSLAIAGLIALSVRRAHVLSREAAQAAAGGAAPPPRPLWASAVIGLGIALVVASLVCLLVGYVALGAFIVKQVVWAVVVLATAYLLCTLVDDACMTWLAAPRQPEGSPDPLVHDAPRLRDQAAVLLSGVARLAIGLCALVLIVAPFGQSPEDLLARAEMLREGLSIGELRLQPGAVLQAVLVFAAGLLAVRALKGWLTQRLLPTTRLDPGMQASAVTLTGYLGGIAALAVALSAVGLGLERIAWVASALSVGIGFGLQAIVSNFVSGLILLAERPVKVGDWVSLSGVEGDIRRINVRATEIQMGDRSTVIVPNSEFITKIVRNITHADPMGLVSLKVPLPVDVPADLVREQFQAALDAHDEVMKTPAATVRLDGVDGDKLVFVVTGFVASPRKAAAVKSDVLFDGLRRLRQVGVLGGGADPAAPAPAGA